MIWGGRTGLTCTNALDLQRQWHATPPGVHLVTPPFAPQMVNGGPFGDHGSPLPHPQSKCSQRSERSCFWWFRRTEKTVCPAPTPAPPENLEKCSGWKGNNSQPVHFFNCWKNAPAAPRRAAPCPAPPRPAPPRPAPPENDQLRMKNSQSVHFFKFWKNEPAAAPRPAHRTPHTAAPQRTTPHYATPHRTIENEPPPRHATRHTQGMPCRQHRTPDHRAWHGTRHHPTPRMHGTAHHT